MKTEWKYLEMGEVCDFIGGSQPPKTDFIFEPKEGYVRLIQIRDYKSDKNITYVPKEKARRFCDNNDIMIGRYGPPLFQILRGLDGAYNVALMKAQPKDNSILNQEYLYYFLKNEKLFNYIVSNSERTAGQDGIKKELLENYIIPLPPIAEQKRIAAILDKADAIRRKRQEAIKLTEELGRSLFLDMFGDPVTNPKGWEVKKLGDLCTIVRGGSPRPINDYLGGTIPWIKIGDATDGDDIYINKTAEAIKPEGVQKSRYLEPGALIFANCGVSLGFARILKIGGCIHDGWLAFSDLDSCINQIFLLKSLNQITQYFRAIAPDGTQPNLNTAIMKTFDIPVPPIYLQEKFVSMINTCMSSQQKQKTLFDESENLFNSLLQRAFKGEL